jgi:ubiquinone biosynthesis protein
LSNEGPQGVRGRARAWLGRASQIAGTFARYGYAPTMQRLGLGRFVPRRFQVAPGELDWPARLRLALQELGPVAIKLGQMLACRPDLLPADYVRELRKLEDAVETFPFEQARAVVESELGRPLEALYAEFSEQPAAAASLAQVHKARLPSGEVVAVKVQRPDAAALVESDLQILLAAARVAERYSAALREARVVDLVLEFSHHMRNELNFYIEANNTEQLGEVLGRFEYGKVPVIYWSHSGRRVLTSEWCPGARPNDREKMRQLGLDPVRAARRLAVLMLWQVFGAGFFHADPHAGNVLVQAGERICFLDAGNCHHVSLKVREEIGAALLALLDQDSDALMEQLLEIGVMSAQTDLEELGMDLDRMISRYVGLRTTDVRIGEAVDQVLALVFKHRVRVPATLGAIGRALMITEGVCRQLDAQFDYRQVAEEELGRIVRGGWWGRSGQRTRRQLRRWLQAADLLPRQLSRLLRQASAGGVRTRLTIEQIDRHLHRLDVIANRLAMALVVAAFIVASALIVASEQATRTLSPLGATLPAVTAGVFGVWLLYSILRSGRL